MPPSNPWWWMWWDRTWPTVNSVESNLKYSRTSPDSLTAEKFQILRISRTEYSNQNPELFNFPRESILREVFI